MTGAASPDATVARDLDRYAGFGGKQAGGAGDMACGTWLAAELGRVGFTVERQTLTVPYFEPQRTELVTADHRAPLWPQPIVTVTEREGITGPIVRVDAAGGAATPLGGAIALVDLPFARWSSVLAKPIRAPIEVAFAAGANAVVVITNGPSGKVIALNTDGQKPMFPGPVALLAPDDAKPFQAAAMRGERATMFLTGHGGRRSAFNFVGRIDRGQKSWLVVSTPRSGWYGCAAERGPGIAVWLALARWASTAVRNHNLAFVCNTGHEYENLGAAQALKTIAPKPAETHFWLHLGANVAARDWHDLGMTAQPLPSVDPQRFLSVSPTLLSLAREVFAGHAGLEAPYSCETLSAGELNEIIAAGYRNVAGVFGIHRFHHVALDDARCVLAPHVAATAAAFRTLVERIIHTPPRRNARKRILPD